MKTKVTTMTFAVMTLLGIQSAWADHVAWSVGFSVGGFSGAVASGPWAPAPVYAAAPVYAPPPVYARPAPLYIRLAPVVYVQPAPVVVAPPVYLAPAALRVPAPVYVAPGPYVAFRAGYYGGHHHPHCR